MNRITLQLSRVRAYTVRTLIVFAVIFPLSTLAQTISPVLSEYRGSADGQVVLSNDTLAPMTVVFEVYGMNVSETGEITYPPLSPDITVKLSNNSVRIPPRQKAFVSYSAKAKTLPAWFVIYAGFRSNPMRDKPGITVQVKLPHTVYILPKKDAAKSDLHIASAVFDRAKNKVSLDLVSTSPTVARVLATELYIGRRFVEAPGFPIFPGKHRKLDVDWKESSAPERVVFEFKDFKLEAPVTVSSQ